MPLPMCGKSVVSLESLPISRRRLTHGSLPCNSAFVKSLDSNFVLAEMSGFKAKSLHIIKKRHQQITDCGYKPLEFFVKGIFPKIIV